MAFKRSSTLRALYTNNGKHIQDSDFVDLAYVQWDGLDDKIAMHFVNVKDFGAKGDGTTDDTAAIQNALNSGINIILEKGKSYLVSTTLTITNSGQQIFGNGATIINSNNISKLISISGTAENPIKNIVIQNLIISASTINYDGTIRGQIDGLYVDGLTIDKCIIKSVTASNSAIYLSFVTNSTIKDCEITEFTQGIFASDCYNSLVSNNKIVSVRVPGASTDGYYAISFDDYATTSRTVKGLNILNNYISGYSVSINVRYGIRGNIVGNTILETALGMTVDRSSYMNVAKNRIEISASTTEASLYIEGVLCNNCIFSENILKCDALLGTGIGIYGDTASHHYNDPYNNIVVNNNIEHVSQGILVSWNAKNTLVEGNNITGCEHGIYANTANITGTCIINNTITNCTIAGIYYKDTYSTYTPSVFHIKNNYVSNSENGIYAQETNLGLSTAFISGNTVIDTVGGRAVFGCFANCHIVDNTVQTLDGYIGFGLYTNTNASGKTIWLLRNQVINGIYKFYSGNTYYTYKNQFINGSILKDGTPTITELAEITY